MSVQVLDGTTVAAQRAAWEAYRAEIETRLTHEAPLFEAVRAQLSPWWEALGQGKTFARKPSYGVRFFAGTNDLLVGGGAAL